LCVIFDITDCSNDPGSADTGASGCGLTGSTDTIAVAGFMTCSANARLIGARLRN